MSPDIHKGNYTGKIQITTTDPAVQNKTVDVPVSYAQLCSGFVVSPTTLNFNVPWGSTGSQSVDDRLGGANCLDCNGGTGVPDHLL